MAVVWLLAGSGPASAQNKPDFSGRWVLDPASAPDPEAPKALNVRQEEARPVTRGEARAPSFGTITIERELATGLTRETHQIGLAGGSVSGEVGAAGRLETRYSVKWDDRALVFEQSSNAGTGVDTPDWSERREVWALGDDGRLRVTIETRSSRSGTRTTIAGYRR